MPADADRLIRYVRRIASPTAANPDGDAALLTHFLKDRDAAAFEALIARHGPMVLRICRRQLADAHDAEDAFQATFLVLAKKAASIRPAGALAAWLHGVACRIALSVRTTVARRRFREVPTSDFAPLDPHPDPLAELTAREALRILDEEVQRLPMAYRLPVVLCCLEGLSQEEAARQLGWTPGSIKGRLERGRKRLHRRLVGRGLELAAALALAEVARGTASGLTGSLAASTGKAALTFTMGGAAGVRAVPVELAALAERGLNHIASAKVKFGLLVLLTVGAVTAGLGAWAYQAPHEEQPKVRPDVEPSPSAKGVEQARTDRYGDPLPPGALARLGTVRWRHGSQVMAVAFSPDGAILASGSMDEAIHLWDAKTGKLLRILRGHGAWVNSVCFTPDGKLLISCGCENDNTARVWDVATGKELRRWPIQGGWNFALSPDGKLLAGNGPPGPNDTIALWDIATGKRVRELPFEGVRDGVIALAFSPDGTHLVSGGGSTLRLFDVNKGKQLRTFGLGKRINSVAFSSDAKTVAVARNGEPVTLWDITTLKGPRRLDSDPKGTRVVAFARDGKTLAACGFGFGKASLWDATTGEKLRELQGTLYQVWGAAFSPDGKTLAVGNLDSRIRLWDIATGEERPSASGHREWVNFLAFIDRDRGIASASGEGVVRHWDLATTKVVQEFQEEGTHCFCGNLSPDGHTLALGDDAGTHLFEWSTGKKLRLLKGHKLQVWAAVFSPKGNVLASSANMDQYILLWDVASGKELRRILTAYLHDLHSLAWSPDGKILASAGARCRDNVSGLFDTVCLWNPETGEPLREWTLRQSKDRQTGGVHALAFSPDGRLLAAADGDNTVVVWDSATGRMRARLPGHSRGVTALKFSPDGHMLASGSMDRTVRLWELATWKERRRYEGHLGGISKLAFSADGLILASASGDTSVLLWSVMGRDPRQRQPDLALAPRQLENLWDDLSSADAPRAWRAICTLARAPKQAVPWLKEHLKPLSAADRKRITHLIESLDSDQFAVRQQAAQELEKLGELAQPAMRKALEGRPSLEIRRQVEQLFEKLDGPVQAAGVMRELRSLEVLERVGTPEARGLLKELGRGNAESRLTREAKASLERLAKRHVSKP